MKKASYKKTSSGATLEVPNSSPLCNEEVTIHYNKKTTYCKLNITSNISIEILKINEIKLENPIVAANDPIFEVNNNNQMKYGLFKLAYILVKKFCLKIIKFII